MLRSRPHQRSRTLPVRQIATPPASRNNKGWEKIPYHKWERPDGSIRPGVCGISRPISRTSSRGLPKSSGQMAFAASTKFFRGNAIHNRANRPERGRPIQFLHNGFRLLARRMRVRPVRRLRHLAYDASIQSNPDCVSLTAHPTPAVVLQLGTPGPAPVELAPSEK